MPNLETKYGLPVPEQVIEEHLAAFDRDTDYIAREAALSVANGANFDQLSLDELDALVAVCEAARRDLIPPPPPPGTVVF